MRRDWIISCFYIFSFIDPSAFINSILVKDWRITSGIAEIRSHRLQVDLRSLFVDMRVELWEWQLNL